MTRLGAAVVAPRVALAIADEEGEAGRAGTDLFLALVGAVVAVHLRALVGAGWLAGAVDAGLGLRAAIDAIAGAATTPLAILLVAAVVIWIGAGRRRAVGRDFDLACVVVVPLLVVEVIATLIVRAADLEVPREVGLALTIASWAWAAALAALAVRQARSEPAPPSEPGAPARRTGVALVAATALLLAVNAGWILTHLDWLRPMQSGDRTPPFALATIEAGGEPGPIVTDEDLAGRVVVLDFWATWCRPCLRALPALSTLAADGEVTVLSINLDDATKARTLWDEQRYRSTLVADDGETSVRFGVGAIPHMVVIDRDGVVRMVARGDGALRDVIDLAHDLAHE